ncbi:uncharacterized protein [Eurosta solidaginis]
MVKYILQFSGSASFLLEVEDPHFERKSRLKRLGDQGHRISSQLLKIHLEKNECHHLFKEYAETNTLSDGLRRVLVNEAVNLLKTQCSNYPTKNEKNAMALAITSLFPNLNTGTGQNSFYDIETNTGYLVSRLKNLNFKRKKLKTNLHEENNVVKVSLPSKMEQLKRIPTSTMSTTKGDNLFSDLDVTNIWLHKDGSMANELKPTVSNDIIKPEKAIHYWTDLQTETLVQTVFEAVYNKPGSFEKPNRQAFYEKLKQKSPILQPMLWISLNSRMKYMKTQYLDAAIWREANSCSNMPLEYLHQKCPHFDKLAVVFKDCVRRNTSRIVYDTAYDDNDGNNKYADASEIVTMPDIKNILLNNSYELELKIEVESRCGTPEPSSSQSCYDIMETECTPPTTAIGIYNRQCTQATKAEGGSCYQQRMYTRPKKKKENPTEVSNNEVKIKQLSLEKEKLEFAKEKKGHEFELKTNKMQKDFELKKLEIERKIESEERLKKFEIELKLKNAQNIL